MKRTDLKHAEIIAGLLLMGLSIYTAVLSTGNPIGWQRGVGPGAGFVPFWLSIMMLVSTTVIVVKAFFGKIPESWNGILYFESTAEAKMVAWHIFSLLVALLIVPFLSLYGSIVFLILFHMKFLGRKHHSWMTTIVLAILYPIGIFLFFEILMQLIMPKGMLDPLFDPIFSLFAASPA